MVSPATGMLSHLVPNCSSRRRYAMKDVAKESWAPDTRLSLYLFISSPPRKIPTATAGRFNKPRRKYGGCLFVTGRPQLQVSHYHTLSHCLTYEEVGSGCRLSKLLFHVFGFEGEQANEGVELQDTPTKEQEVGRSSQQALQCGKKPCARTPNKNTSNDHILLISSKKQNDEVSLVFCNGKKKKVLTFSDVSQVEAVAVAEGIARPGLAIMFGYVSLVLWQRARQEPEGNAGDEQEAGRNQEAHPPGTHPPGIFRSDGHTFWMMGKRCRTLCNPFVRSKTVRDDVL